jgi:hypothetical protein
MATYTVYEVPFTNRPQVLSTRLAGNRYSMKLIWNVYTDCWIVDIYTEEGIALLCGMAIVTGADLLAQFRYLEIGGQLFATTDHTRGNMPPTFTDLGITGHVFFLPDDAQPVR